MQAPQPQPDQATVGAMMPHIKPILKAFGEGFSEGWGPDQLGISEENKKVLQRCRASSGGQSLLWAQDFLQRRGVALGRHVLPFTRLVLKTTPAVGMYGRA
jgi:hypothetical protein